jgi:hypothetical protein
VAILQPLNWGDQEASKLEQTPLGGPGLPVWLPNSPNGLADPGLGTVSFVFANSPLCPSQMYVSSNPLYYKSAAVCPIQRALGCEQACRILVHMQRNV